MGLWFAIFGWESLIWDLCLRILGLGSLFLGLLVWNSWFGGFGLVSFRLGSLAWTSSAWNLRIGIYGLGSLICDPGLGEPAGLDGGTGAPVVICLVIIKALGKNPSS